MFRAIGKRIALSGVKRHVRVAHKVLDFALLTAKRAYQDDPSRYGSLGAAVWEALECRPGWTRKDYNSWEYSNGVTVDRYEGEQIPSVFLSMLIVELSEKIKIFDRRDDLFEAIIGEWKTQHLKAGMPIGKIQDIIDHNRYAALGGILADLF